VGSQQSIDLGQHEPGVRSAHAVEMPVRRFIPYASDGENDLLVA
jgi:hypothetical protein